MCRLALGPIQTPVLGAEQPGPEADTSA